MSLHIFILVTFETTVLFWYNVGGSDLSLNFFLLDVVLTDILTAPF